MDSKRNSPKTRVWLWLLVPIAAIALHGVFFLYLNGPLHYFTPEKLGAVGDSFGWLNALFSGLAFSGLIITLLLQLRQLELQREELAMQRDELRLQREEMTLARAETEKMANAQSRSAEIARLVALIHECESRINLFTAPGSPVNAKPALSKALKGWKFEDELDRKGRFVRELVEMS